MSSGDPSSAPIHRQQLPPPPPHVLIASTKNGDPLIALKPSFVLPQYTSLVEHSFLSNSTATAAGAAVQQHHSRTGSSSLQTKDKLAEIASMMQYFSAASSSSLHPSLSAVNSPTSSRRNASPDSLANNNNTSTSAAEGVLLKNEHTIAWLKKRYLDSGNRKYFGDEEDVQQAAFIRALFQNITRHIQTPHGIHLTDFNRLLASFELPITYTTLNRLYAIVDANRDGSLNLSEFSEFVMSDATNRVYLDQFKSNAVTKQFANLPYRPTSLSALCIFVSFRIIHDYLIDFLYDPAFQVHPYQNQVNNNYQYVTYLQVKEKSQGLGKMLELIKVQGETRIKKEQDKRMIRKLKVENVPSLGFGAGLSLQQHLQPQNRQSQQEFTSYSNPSINQEEPILNEKYEEQGDYDDMKNKVVALDKLNVEVMKQKDEQMQEVEEERVPVRDVASLVLPSIKGKTREHQLSGYLYSKSKGAKSMFEREIIDIVGKANIRGQESAVSSFEQQKETLRQLRVDALVNVPERTNFKERSVLRPSLSTSFLMKGDHSSAAIGAGGLYTSRNMENDNSMTRLMGGGSGGSMTSRYSKHMGQLMELTMQQADKSRQAAMARRILSVEDSSVMKITNSKIKSIKKAEQNRLAVFAQQAIAMSSKNMQNGLVNATNSTSFKVQQSDTKGQSTTHYGFLPSLRGLIEQQE